MKAQDLKNSILQLAIQGKLVEQREEEGTARELLGRIKSEKEQLIKDGKIKKEKPLPEIREDEIPFDIPENWEWVRLGELCEKIGSGSTPTGGKSVYKESGIKFLRSQNIYNEGLRMEGVAYISEEQNKQGSIVKPRDILLNITGGSIGRCALVPDDFDIANINQHVMIIRNLVLDNRFLLHYILISPYVQSMIMSVQVGVSREGISAEKLKNFLIPLPPLGEQKRIVAKIEELMPYVEKYGEAHSKLDEFNKKFPEDMQKSILQYAIQGKLVEQRKEEGSAEELYQQIQEEKAKLIKEGKIKKEKPLAEITEDEIPFEIPKNWKWVRFGDIMINRDAERIPLSVTQRESLEKIYDYYGASGVIDKVDNYIFDKKLMLIGEDGANLLTRSKPIAFLAEGKYWVNNHAHVIDCGENMYLEYVMNYINAISLAKYVTGTAQPKMNQAKLNSIPVPLPPLEEQKRIVAKIEEMMPYCQQLVK